MARFTASCRADQPSPTRAHTNPRVILKMDLKDFFPTVTLARVKGIFRKAGYREQTATLLALLCTEAPRELVELDGQTYFVSLGPRCLPQGAPTSPALTNTLCLRLDRRVSGLARKLGFRYTRYADDLTFSLPGGHSGKASLKTLLGAVRAIVEAEGFRLNPEKTRVPPAWRLPAGDGAGGQWRRQTPGAAALRRQLRAALHNLRHGKPLPEGETIARLAGYAAYVCMTDLQLGHKLLAALPKGQPGT